MVRRFHSIAQNSRKEGRRRPIYEVTGGNLSFAKVNVQGYNLVGATAGSVFGQYEDALAAQTWTYNSPDGLPTINEFLSVRATGLTGPQVTLQPYSLSFDVLKSLPFGLQKNDSVGGYGGYQIGADLAGGCASLRSEVASVLQGFPDIIGASHMQTCYQGNRLRRPFRIDRSGFPSAGPWRNARDQRQHPAGFARRWRRSRTVNMGAAGARFRGAWSHRCAAPVAPRHAPAHFRADQ
jgi:hypothetical protein